MANEFQYRGQLNGAANPVILPMLIANSSTVVVGRAVKMQSLGSGGGVIAATAGSLVAGIVQGIVDKNGIDMDNSVQSITGTWTSSTQSFASSSTNTTVDLVKALVVVDKQALWYNDSAGDMAVADEYKFFDLLSAAQVADQNGHDTAGAFQLIKRNPDGDDDASKGIFRIAESNSEPYAQQ